MKPVIEVSDISKSYLISHQEKASYDTIKDDFAKLIKKPFGGTAREERETFWALKNINFHVNQGETFGIVGKNGSGKSTLLKILSRIVDPSSGTIKINGKVASLLEVGTGFHPELTGRENIYFNGSMIGMTKQEIAKKFDEIVDFSEVEKFLDTPVKFYSSGMFVRLAFAVAAHLDSEILILDEVLSVGDASFQRKSMNKMLEIAKDGRTILFVSHSMSSVQEICSRAMWLKNGKIKMIGNTEEITEAYLGKDSPKELEKAAQAKILAEYHELSGKVKNVDLSSHKDRTGNGKIKITKVTFKNNDGKTGSLVSGQDGEILIEFDLNDPSLGDIDVSLGIDTMPAKVRVANISTKVIDQTVRASARMLKLQLKKLNLSPGMYQFTVFADKDTEVLDWVKNAGVFEVKRGNFYGTGIIPDSDQGVLLLDYKVKGD